MDSQVYGVWADTRAELISYRYLGCRSVLGEGFEAQGSMSIRGDMRREGALLAAPVAIAMLDTAGIAVDRHWHLALTHVDVKLSDHAAVSTLAVHGSMTRRARSQVFTEARFVDADESGRVVGIGTADWAVIADTAMGFEYLDPGPGVPDTADLPPLAEAYGAVRGADGRSVIPELTPRLGGLILHHGPILVVLETAALQAAGPGVRVAALGVRIVRAGKRGPFVVSARVLSDHADDVLVRAELTQDGDDANVVAVATLTLVRERKEQNSR